MQDDNFDKIMARLMSDRSATDDEVAEIAESPNLRRAVMREIGAGHTHAAMPWPPTKWFVRAIAFGVPSIAAAAVLIAFTWVPPADGPGNVSIAAPESQIAQIQPVSTPSDSVIVTEPPRHIDALKTRQAKRSTPRPAARIRSKHTPQEVPEPQETRSEFIALSYARNPDSGQIVRVKVPSAMMVSVGLVQTVDKPADLVDAEVLVGDDGLTHAIRFIRQE